MTKIKSSVFIFFSLFVSIAPACAAAPQDAVVKIFVTSNRVDFARPWQSEGSRAASGSGFIVEGNRILTNAHVVNDSTFIQVRKEADPRKYIAKVSLVGYDCDLAILTVEDPEFFQNVEPFSFGELPKLQDKVTVLGFPMGGDKLSITEGVVSRIEIIPYAESGKRLLAVQIDAAINPGNSGGPVLQNGKVIGVAMQMIWGSQNIGYTIPAPIIDHFLKDAGDGKYDGFPMVGMEHSSIESKSLKNYFQVPKNLGGVLVSWVWPFSSGEKSLQPDDIVVAIDDVPLGEDGTFEFRPGERLTLSHLITSKQIDEKITVKVLRSGKVETRSFPLKPFVGLVPSPNEIEKPPYFIYGGLVFSTLSMDLLRTKGPDWWKESPPNYLEYIFGTKRLNEKRKKDIVVLLEVLPDDVNVGYHNFQDEIVEKVNGQEFSSFEEFVKLVEKVTEKFIVFETDQHNKIILDRNNIDKITKEIVKRNNIPRQFSESVDSWLNNDPR